MPDPVELAVAAERDEVRRMIDAGASSPEELRALAERMRQQRELEATVWSAEVKPALRKARKAKFTVGALRKDQPLDKDPEATRFLVGAGLLAFVVLVLFAIFDAPFIVVLVPLIAFLGYAYALGRAPDEAAAADPPDGEPLA